MAPPHSIDLRDRVALVTGAANGLGRAMARALVGAGAAVVFADIDEAALSGAVADLGPPGRAIAVRCDVSQRRDCEAAVDAAKSHFGALHIVVNNAGKGPRQVAAAKETTSMRFWETDPQAWREVIDTNVIGVYLMSRAAVPSLLASGSGRIVNITTSLSTMQRRMNSPYGVSKAAIETETLIFAKDLEGTGVTCNSLIPGGAADTGFVSSGAREAMAREGRSLLSPEVMIAPILWLASRQSDGVTARRIVGKLWDPALPAETAWRHALEPPVLLAAAEPSA